jgi:hypothetical protein
MPETMAKVVVPLHIVDMWLGGKGLEIWYGLIEKKMNGGGEGVGRSGDLGMRETTGVLETDISLFLFLLLFFFFFFFKQNKTYRFRDFEINRNKE